MGGWLDDRRTRHISKQDNSKTILYYSLNQQNDWKYDQYNIESIFESDNSKKEWNFLK